MLFLFKLFLKYIIEEKDGGDSDLSNGLILEANLINLNHPRINL